MTLEEAKDLIYLKKKETRIKIRTLRAKSDFADFDLDKALLDEYDKYKEYIREITPMIRDKELSDLVYQMYKPEICNDWLNRKEIIKSCHNQFNRYCSMMKMLKEDTVLNYILQYRVEAINKELKKELNNKRF